MRSGFAAMALNYEDWGERYEPNDFSGPPSIPDVDILRDTTALAEMAEPLGFDSIWAPEHHTSPYCMTPNPLLYISYLAGRTKKVDFGTMVIVLPWHHPMHVAGEIALLDDILSQSGRNLYVGMGRGLSAREFDSFGIDRNEARERYIESVEVIKLAIANEQFSFDGEHYTIPKTQLRPRPTDRLGKNLLGAFGSASSLPVVANLDLEMLFTAGHTAAKIGDFVGSFNEIRKERGLPPNHPRAVFWMYCGETDAEVEQGLEYMARFHEQEAGGHYLTADEQSSVRFQNVKGYEDYAAGHAVPTVDDMKENQVIGTPEECLEKVLEFQRMSHAMEFIYICRFGGMPHEAAEKSLKLFAEKVLPAARDIKVEPFEVAA